MIIENEFTVPVHPDRALELLTDVPRIAPCVPGVMLTEVRPDRSYDGTASVRLGPVALTFDGTARIEQIDEAAQTARVSAEGKDKKGRGRASADVTFRIVPDGEASRVFVTTDLVLTGTVAQYGRASGLITEVANQIIAEFVRNLETELQSGSVAAAGAAASAKPAPASVGTTGAAARTTGYPEASGASGTPGSTAADSAAGGSAAASTAAGAVAGNDAPASPTATGAAASNAGAAADGSAAPAGSTGSYAAAGGSAAAPPGACQQAQPLGTGRPPQLRPARQLSGFVILRRALLASLKKLFARK